MARWNHEVRERIDRLELPFDRHGFDPYGVSRDELVRFFSPLAWLYRRYFPVRCFGARNVPARGRAMLIGNHAGGVALDASMVLTSLLFELEPPRLGHGMVEKFMSRIPFMGENSARAGQLTGLPEHALRLLADERVLMVFPEGARGTAKLYWQRHSLVDFGTGFMRLAMQARAPIVPFAFIGGGEAIPTVMNLRGLGRLLGVPYLPVTPYLLPLPLPVPLELHYSEPMRFEGTGREDDELIEANVAEVKGRIAAMIAEGVRRRKAGEVTRESA